MALFDQHVHSWHSFDSETGPAKHCEAAIEKGLFGLTFTEHYDRHPEDWPTCRYNDGKINEAVNAAREWFGHKLFVGKGIEVCYQPELMPSILEFLGAHQFDLVMLSVHWAGGRSLYKPDGWSGQWRERTREYLATVLEATRFCAGKHAAGERPFDVLGHLDLAKRYSARFCGAFDIESYRDLVDRILRHCVAAELAIEINTSTLRQGLGEPMPADWVVEQYIKLGGKMITVGSDAHSSSELAYGLTDALVTIKSKGLSHVTVFRDRRPHFLPI
jgi:histidinol-phosphatase (PHP family)